MWPVVSISMNSAPVAEDAGERSGRSAASPLSSRPTVSVKTRGLSALDRQLLIATAVGAVIGYPLVAFAVVHATTATLGARLLIFTAVLGCASLGVSNLQCIRRVDVDDGGVTLRYVVRRVRVPWPDFAPPGPNRYAKAYGGIFVRRILRRPAGEVRRGHFVTRDQARAILTHPNCPRWDLEPSLREFLGL